MKRFLTKEKNDQEDNIEKVWIEIKIVKKFKIMEVELFTPALISEILALGVLALAVTHDWPKFIILVRLKITKTYMEGGLK